MFKTMKQLLPILNMAQKKRWENLLLENVSNSQQQFFLFPSLRTTNAVSTPFRAFHKLFHSKEVLGSKNKQGLLETGFKTGVKSWFADLLPKHWMNDSIR